MGDLQSRGAAFLRGCRVISEPGRSLAALVERYADGKPWDDPEWRERLSRGILVARSEAAKIDADSPKGWVRDARLFDERLASILQDIEAEVSTGRD